MYGVHILQFSNTGSAKAGSTENDIEYLTPVQIGTPPRTLDLLFDTGSSDLWIQYGDGASPNGNVYQDVIAVGGLKVQKQAVQTAQKVSRDFTNDTMSSGPHRPRRRDSTGYAIGSNAFTKTPIANIADTGSSLMLLPDEIVNSYYRGVQDAHYDDDEAGFIFDCAAKLPDFSFGVGNTIITIPVTYMNFSYSRGPWCFGGIQSSADTGFNIFGGIALKAALVVFDGGNNRIGWAAKSLC
ncbi:hypothetical protein E4U34_002792 [Claviceps purpurea]|nr:hypothetical protein E4U34_002792 [Claviceps purpurea]